jgi:DNA-binding MarR family transcriptional regulator
MTGLKWFVIQDETVSQIWNRPDLNRAERDVLIDIYARQPEPEKVEGSGPLGQTEVKQGMALATVKQIVERTKFSEATVKRTIRRLEQRKLLTRRRSKGRTPSAYLVTLRSKPSQPE